MSGSLSTTATSSMRPPMTAGPISRNLSGLSAAARSGGGGTGVAAAKNRQIAAASMPRKISCGLVLATDAVADHLNKLFEIERFEDGITHGVGWDLLHAALSGGGEHDDVRAAALGHFLSNLLDEFVSVEARHHQVQEDQIERAVPAHFVQSHRAILGQLDVELHSTQNGLQ